MEAAELAVERRHADQRPAHGHPGQGAAEAATDEAERGQTQMTEDQSPAEQEVERDPRQAEPQDDARPLQGRNEIAQQLEHQPRRGAPHVGAEERLPLLGELRRLAERAHDVADVPQDEPVGRHCKQDQPQPGAKRPPHVAHGIRSPPERGRHHRRGGGDKAEQEDVESEGQVERQGRAGELGRAEAAHQQDVGRLDHLLGQIGEHQRPGERQGGAKLIAPRAAVHRG